MNESIENEENVFEIEDYTTQESIITTFAYIYISNASIFIV